MEFIDRAIKNGREVKERQKSALELPKELFERYGDFPKDYAEFIASVAACTNPTDTAWFLCSEEYTAPYAGRMALE